ncbi:MAG: HTTM domain-containing protein [Planctomycetota bacterium]
MGSEFTGNSVRGPGGLLKNYFFPEAMTTRLAVLRILCVAAYLLWFMYPLSYDLELLAHPGFKDPQWLTQALVAVFGESNVRHPLTITLVYDLSILAGMLALVGWWTRTSLGVFTACFWFLLAHRYSYGEFHHVETVFGIFLFMLAFSPCGDCLSLDAWHRQRDPRTESDRRSWRVGSISRMAMWPIVTVQILFALVYFDAAASKMINGGLYWFNGYTMQDFLLTDGYRNDRPLGVWLSKYREICILMSVAAVAYEGLFWLALVPRLKRYAVPMFLAGGVMLHLGIFFLQAAPFFMWMTLYGVWFPWERLSWLRAGQPSKSEAAEPAGLADLKHVPA